jgi:hypothetical protein
MKDTFFDFCDWFATVNTIAWGVVIGKVICNMLGI